MRKTKKRYIHRYIDTYIHRYIDTHRYIHTVTYFTYIHTYIWHFGKLLCGSKNCSKLLFGSKKLLKTIPYIWHFEKLLCGSKKLLNTAFWLQKTAQNCPRET